ncbi:MAG: hypothetical protein R3B84_01455 [Zavarzinella sp.]
MIGVVKQGDQDTQDLFVKEVELEERLGNPIIQPKLHAHECGYYEIIIPFGPPLG